MENNHFITEDINLAAYLNAKDIELIGIEPINSRQSHFVFAQPPQKLLQEWLSGNAIANAYHLISSYRHLVRDARLAQENFGERMSIASQRRVVQ